METERSASESGGDGDDDPELQSILRAVARLPPPPVREPDRVGTEMAHFHVEERLGAGGMGIVYAARDTKLRRRVALKVLPVAMVADTERRQRFLREARSASAVMHPNLTTIFDFGEVDGTAYIAMELVQGETLRRRLTRAGPLDPREAGRVAAEMARGLGEAHAAGIVHRDLKPENVMIEPGGRVKVLDFGLAKLHGHGDDPGAPTSAGPAPDDLSRASRVVGTRGYMSPEQATGGGVDARTDVFTIGVILHEMLTGTLPFPRTTPHDQLGWTSSPKPGSAPAPLADVLARCLARDPGARFTDGRALAAALESACRKLAAGGARRRGARLAAAAAAIAAVAIAVPTARLLARGRARPLEEAPASGRAEPGSLAREPPGGLACASASECASGRCTAGHCVPWLVVMTGPGPDTIGSIDVGADGDILVSGHSGGATDLGCGPLLSDGPPDHHDAVVARFNGRGTCLWSRRFGRPDTAGATSAFLANGHVLVAGGFGGTIDLGGGPLRSAGEGDLFVAELDGRGGHVWSVRFGGPGQEGMHDAKVDAAGNIVITGWFTAPATDLGGVPLVNASGHDRRDVFVLKLDSTGHVLWAKRFGGPSDDFLHWCAIDARGDIALTGTFRETIDLGGGPLRGTGRQIRFLAKISGADGAHRWSRAFGGSDDDRYEGDVAFARDGDLVAVGEHQGADLGGGPLPGSIYVARLGGGGEHRWSRGFGGSSPRDGARRVAIDPEGDVVVTGRIFSPSVAFDDIVVANAGGADVYVATLDGATGRVRAVRTFFATDAPVRALALHPVSGNVVVGGRYEGTLRIGTSTEYAAGQDGFFASLGPAR